MPRICVYSGFTKWNYMYQISPAVLEKNRNILALHISLYICIIVCILPSKIHLYMIPCLTSISTIQLHSHYSCF